jgi:hypothetical protein
VVTPPGILNSARPASGQTFAAAGQTTILTRAAGSDRPRLQWLIRLCSLATLLLPNAAWNAPRLRPQRGDSRFPPFGTLQSSWASGVVLLGCSIPISVPTHLLGVILFFWLAGGGYGRKLAAIRGNPVAWMALALFALFLAGSLYSIGSPHDVLDALTRALRLLLIPALIYLMRERVWRERGIAAFLAAMLVTLGLSYLYWLGVLPGNEWLKKINRVALVIPSWKPTSRTIVHGLCAFLLAQRAYDAKTRGNGSYSRRTLRGGDRQRVLMVPGRTGIIVLLVLFVYFLGRALKARGS